jgi:hypothetical protein
MQRGVLSHSLCLNGALDQDPLWVFQFIDMGSIESVNFKVIKSLARSGAFGEAGYVGVHGQYDTMLPPRQVVTVQRPTYALLRDQSQSYVRAQIVQSDADCGRVRA